MFSPVAKVGIDTAQDPEPSEVKHDDWDRTLDDEFYDPDPEALAFYKKETGIDDDSELKQHILRVQKEAFSVSFEC